MIETIPSKDSLAVAHRKTLGEFAGDFFEDETTRRLYATDASVYEELPRAVALPRGERDIRLLIEIARASGLGLIPRTAGTSLAGQVVGGGIVVDVSRYMCDILEINAAEHWVRVQPGVIRNELNMTLARHGLLFGPETSTANRAMIGGMLGNNSCGSNSIIYGTTRENVLAVRGLFSDGSAATLCDRSPSSLQAQPSVSGGESREQSVHRQMYELLSDPLARASIAREFPDPRVSRRNTGYAVDLLAETQPFGDYERPFNLAQLVAGSEGTLFFATEIKLRCWPLPPPQSVVIGCHFDSVDQALRANIIAMDFSPFASELIDHHVLAGAARNLAQQKNMAFVEGEPKAILIVQLRDASRGALAERADELVGRLRDAKLGYHFPRLFNEDAAPVWELRKAGLGVAASIPGDTKPVTVIEDTAVNIHQLPEYIRELNQILDEFGFECVHYGHAGSGELHLRPLINLKTSEGQQQFRQLAERVAVLVKKYRGSLSGEHGDGRLRGQFLQQMVGEENYNLLKQVKRIFDPENLFNPGKIVDAPSILDSLRVKAGNETNREAERTVFDFSATGGMLGAAEMCSGSGDCRKTQLSGGTMCPSYMATRNEQDSTRARANLLRQALTSRGLAGLTRQDEQEVKHVLDLCLSCKGCKRECPSNVDLAKLKAEFTNAYQAKHGIPLRSRLFAGIDRANYLNSFVPWLYNFLVGNRWTGSWLKRASGVHQDRQLPRIHGQTLRGWFKRHVPHANAGRLGKVWLFCDEFTNYNDVPVGIAAVELFERLGLEVEIPRHVESGRASISKGLLHRARQLAIANVDSLASIVTEAQPLVGLEPSALLSFRDEYPDLVPPEMQQRAKTLAANCLLAEEMLARLGREQKIGEELFAEHASEIWLHGHCHQKALSSMADCVQALELPANYRVHNIPSGCCGMAGSFGYESEHFELSMEIGELVLFPAIRQLDDQAIVAAAGTSCRHQIIDGTGREAYHPVQILREALRPEN